MMMDGMGLLARQAPPMMGPPPSPEYLAWDARPKLLAIDCTLFGIAMVTVVLRIYVRGFVLKVFGIDDWLMIMSTLLSMTCMALFIKVVTLGIGKHIEAVPFTHYPDLFKYLYFYAILIIFAYSFIKLSIGFFLLRLADRTRWRRFLQGTLIFLVVFTLGSTLAIIFQCIPVKAGYDMSLRPPIGNAKCYPVDVFKNIGVFNSSINIATDLLFALVPIPIVWKLQVNTRTKIGLGFILGLGLFASATAIYKTPMQYNFFKERDWTGNGSWYYIWQQVEMNIGITAANLPTLKPLFASFFGHIKSLTNGSNGRTTGRSAGYAFRGSSGYLKQSDFGVESPATASFALSNLSGNAEKGYRVKSWDRRRQSQAGESDESILRECGVGVGRGEGIGRVPSGRVIVKTTEVNVS